MATAARRLFPSALVGSSARRYAAWSSMRRFSRNFAAESLGGASEAKLVIRELQEGDYESWRRLWALYLEFYKEPLPDEVSTQTFSRLIDPKNTMQHCLIAETTLETSSTTPLVGGFATYLLHPSTWSATPYCYLEDLFVDSSLRGRGTGRALISELYRRADRKGWSRVYWATTDDNYTARTLYDKIAKKTDFIQYRRGPSA